jgi:TadE-like protein
MRKRSTIGRGDEGLKVHFVGRPNPLRSAWDLLRMVEGAELLELGLALPILLVLVVGIIDFAKAYNTKHVMSNAAREAARMIVSTPLSNSSCPSGWDPSSPGSGTPCPVQAAAISVANYMSDAGLTAASCLTSASPTYSGTRTWTYTCSNVTLVINKAYVIPGVGGGSSISGTHVTLSYPYTFIFGRIVGLLSILHITAAGPTGQYIFTTDSTMQNLAAD